MPSPVSRQHSNFHFPLTAWLGNYVAGTPGCEGSLECTWLMGAANVPQPDITLQVVPERGGQSRVEGSYAAGVSGTSC